MRSDDMCDTMRGRDGVACETLTGEVPAGLRDVSRRRVSWVRAHASELLSEHMRRGRRVLRTLRVQDDETKKKRQQREFS